jgi:outer membrane receptor protein involved in Fe transport
MIARPSTASLARLSLLAFTMLLAAAPARAQFDTAQVSGAIQDGTGGVLPGADVVLIAVGTGLERRTVSNESGLYTFVNVPVGDYRINATLSGFKPVARTGVRVNAGVNIRVDIQLELGGLTETVQVEAATTLIDTSVIGRTVRSEQIADTPLGGRRATQVAQFVPGTIGGGMGGLPTAAATFATGITSINGGRSEEFITTVDGAPSIRVRANGGFTMGMQNADTVEEVQVLTTNYQAEHGRASAGLLRLVTKSGTQQFRGNAFWTGQDDSLNANTWTNNRAGIAKSPSNFNQYGFTIGGPIYLPGRFNTDRSKLFFFWGEEWDRIRSVENQQATVPSAAMRNGDFSELLNPANTYFRAVRRIRDPLLGLPCTAADQRGCFPGNIIPRERISPNGLALLNSYPLPTPGFLQGTNNWIGTPSTFDDTRKDSIKIDYVPANNHRISVRHTWAPHVWNDPESASAFSSIWDYPGRTMAATYTGTLSSTLINEASFSWGSTKPARFFGQRNCDYCPGGPGLVEYPTRSQIGLNYPFIFPGTKLDPDKLSNLAIQNFTTLTLNQFPGYWYDFVFVWSDSVTKIQGNHTFKAGVSVERSGMKDQIQLSAATAPATTNQNGSFRFFDTGTAADGTPAIANALLGQFSDYTEFGDKPLTNFIGMGYDFYAQDSWKPTRQLTVELGLRYSLWQQWRDENNAIASFQAEFYDPARAVTIDRAAGFVVPGSGDPFNGIVLPGDRPTEEALAQFPQLAGLERLYRGLPPGFAPDPKDGFQPRLGMAYAFSDAMTIRSGIGLFLNRPQINTSAAYGFNPPLSEMATVINGNVDAPSGAQRRTFPLVMAMFSPDYENARSWAWNVTMDRQLPWQNSVQLSYVGRSATNLERARNINQLQPGTLQANPGVNANALRPYKGFGTITLYETTGRSRYNAMQLQVQRRSARGLGYSLAYTLSRTKDDGSSRLEIVPNAYDDSGLYSISSLDRPHVLITQVSYRTPELSSSPAALRGVLGDWNIGGVLQAQSGAPFHVTTTVDRAGVGPGSGGQFYNIVGDPDANRTDFDGTRAVWFNPAAFEIPTLGTYATRWERNNLRQPSFWDLHLSLRKGVAVGTHRVELKWDLFNVLNHTNLGNANSNPTSADFGTITSRTGNRTMQIGLQYVF